MKAFDDLTDTELDALSNDEIEFYINLACANEGVPLLPTEPTQPTAPEVADDLVVYKVAYDLYVTTPEAAAEIAAVINKHPRGHPEYISGPSYRQRFIPRPQPVEVAPQRVLSQDMAVTMRSLIEEHERQKKEYAEQQVEYDRARSARSEIESAIRDKVYAAHRAIRVRNDRQSLYNRYLTLADGDANIAKRFLRQAYSDSPSVLPELFPGVEVAPQLETVAVVEAEIAF